MHPRSAPRLRAVLREGMRPGDLSGLVLPLLSVDEYESKIDATAVAIGFYVHDQAAANDLNRFLQKSPVALLNSEVSPAPDQHGFFIVFIELLPDAQIADNLHAILKELEPLCEIEQWKMRVRKTVDLQAFSTKTFLAALKKARRADEAIVDFFAPTALDNVLVKGTELVLEAQGVSRAYRILGFGTVDEIACEFDLDRKISGVSLYEVARCRRVAALLGEGWFVTETEGHILLQHVSTDTGLLLTDLDRSPGHDPIR